MLPPMRTLFLTALLSLVLLATVGCGSGESQGSSSSPSWVDHAQTWATVAAAAVAAAGLTGVLLNVRAARLQQRIQSGPYVRIDISPTSLEVGGFKPPKPHHVLSDSAIDLSPGAAEDQKVTISAWATNYQTHPLGFALRVAFLVVVETPGPGEPAELGVTIPYLEQDKPIQVDLVKISRNEEVTVRLLFLSYYDLYDRKVEQGWLKKGTNALHGRLACTYSKGDVDNSPQAWPTGSNVSSTLD